MPKFSGKIILGIITTIAVVFFLLSPVEAHPGKTASDGCHYCKTNCDKWGVPWNERHCHGGSQNPPPQPKSESYTPASAPYIVYPTWTPKPRPTVTPKPTNTLIPPTVTLTPTTIPASHTITPSITLSSTHIVNIGEVANGVVAGDSTKIENESFLTWLFKNIINIFTFDLLKKEEEIISPIVEISSTQILVQEENKITPTTSSILGESINPTILNNGWVEVISITDGDTFRIRIEGKIENVRLIGIDTPETVDPRKPVQCFGQEASNKAKELLSGHKVKLESDPAQSNRDRYNRLLRYAWREDGLFYNDWIIRNGYAHEYTYDLPYKYQEQFKEAEKYARENNIGLWSPLACISPTLIQKPQTIDNQNTDNKLLIIEPKTITEYPIQEKKENTGYTCNCSKNCDEMSSCDEAYFQLNQCGCSRRDGDKDGIPCENICR